jgi:hypothetical protein
VSLWVVSFIVQESRVCPATPQWKHGLLAAAEVCAVLGSAQRPSTSPQATAMSVGVEFAQIRDTQRRAEEESEVLRRHFVKPRSEERYVNNLPVLHEVSHVNRNSQRGERHFSRGCCHRIHCGSCHSRHSRIFVLQIHCNGVPLIFENLHGSPPRTTWTRVSLVIS